MSDFKRRREVELKHGRVAMLLVRNKRCQPLVTYPRNLHSVIASHAELRFATIGYILPEYWRFPGYLSKFLDLHLAVTLQAQTNSDTQLLLAQTNHKGLQEAGRAQDVKFADVPNGLSAFSKVPALGWLQIVGFAGLIEINVPWTTQVTETEQCTGVCRSRSRGCW